VVRNRNGCALAAKQSRGKPRWLLDNRTVDFGRFSFAGFAPGYGLEWFADRSTRSYN
jgi:hypothetical protein